MVDIISKNLEPIKEYILRWYPVLSETSLYVLEGGMWQEGVGT